MFLIIIIFDLIIGIITSIFSFQLNIYIEILIGIGFSLGLLLFEAFIFFLIVILFSLPINKNKRYKYSKIYEKLFRAYEKFALKLFNTKIIIKGMDLIPKDNYIIVSNHRSNLDSFVIDTILKKDKLIFAAKKSLFNIPWFGKIIWKNNYLYITRTNPKTDIKELNYGISLVNDESYSIGIFPEGKRNFENDLVLPFSKGYQLLLNKTNKPLVIVALKGTSDIKNNLFFKKHIVIFEVLEVLNYEKYNSMTKDELDDYVMNLMIYNLKQK